MRPLYPMRSRALRIVLLLMGFFELRSPGKSHSLLPVSICRVISTSKACLDNETICGVASSCDQPEYPNAQI